MKQLITAIACVVLLLVFLPQFTANQASHNKILYVENAVDTFVEEIKQEGYITQTAKQNLEILIADKLDCDVSAVIVSGTTTGPLIRGSIIEYRVEYPVKDVIAMASFWGIDDNDNTANKVIEGSTVSEYVKWD